MNSMKALFMRDENEFILTQMFRVLENLTELFVTWRLIPKLYL